MADKDVTARSAYQKAYQKKYKSKNKTVNVTLSKAEYQRLVDAGKKVGQKPTTMMRTLAFAALDGGQIMTDELVVSLKEHNMLIRSVANNINQMAHAANIFSDADRAAIMNELSVLQGKVARFISSQQDNG